MGKYFGTDGFRGEANVGLTVEHAFKIGRYLGYYFGHEHPAKIVIGKDTRRSSYMLEYALTAGLTASGADAYLLHVTTTPSVSYVVKSDDFDCGVMITASHNPFYDNGIKIINHLGYKIEADVEALIEQYIDGEIGEIPLAKREFIGKTIDYSLGRNRYIGHLVSLATRSFKDKRVGLDMANGASTTIAKNVFDTLGAKTYCLGDQPDGLNINMGCGSTHMEKLKAFVVENGLDCGFAFDGDADRCLAVDEDGNEINGDQIMYIVGRYLKERGELTNNTVVTTVMSNMGLYKALEAADIEYTQTKVGDKYVFENMMQYGHSIGGENSGHIIFSKYASTGDGILTAIKLMEIMIEKKSSLKALAKDMTIFPQVLKNVRVYSKSAAQGDEAVVAKVEEVKALLGNDGRILVRESGTEPVIRVMVEAPTLKQCEECVDSVIEVIKKRGHVVA
ncbi:MAG: phosphoglucosamine mutase [Lachnospiraceae bacterium]|nr:phosphoglucosamine mutase [Lachnospiraceae bacterium]